MEICSIPGLQRAIGVRIWYYRRMDLAFERESHIYMVVRILSTLYNLYDNLY